MASKRCAMVRGASDEELDEAGLGSAAHARVVAWGDAARVGGGARAPSSDGADCVDDERDGGSGASAASSTSVRSRGGVCGSVEKGIGFKTHFGMRVRPHTHPRPLPP